MKRELLTWTAAMTVMGALAGGAYAQSTPDTGVPSSTSPSTTPNDGTAVPPNTPVPPGQIPPPVNTNPSQGSQGTMGSQPNHATGTSTGTPGSQTGLPTTENQVPNRAEPGTNEPKIPNTGAK
ncbi:hypothetical protein [Bordetella sp. 15P40C-2]|uniref:hypothetical protein n=1 Tax=Bordetella sp. 15P40C-2 TaxID=2572246 RepID=UPI001F488172|nr:hypothetical protein [Bordetella sp. 15P40C-2]